MMLSFNIVKVYIYSLVDGDRIIFVTDSYSSSISEDINFSFEIKTNSGEGKDYIQKEFNISDELIEFVNY